MAIDARDFQIDAAGNIRRAAAPFSAAIYSVLDLHTFLQDLADNLTSSGDDAVSIRSANPSKLDGPRDPLVASRLNLINGYNIDDSVAQFISKGSIKQASGNTLYSGLKSIGSIVPNSSIYVVQGTGKLSKYWPNDHIQIMVKTKTAGNFISGGAVTVFSRQWGNTFSAFDVDLTAGGENSAALATSVDNAATLTLANALALGAGGTPKVSISFGATTLDLGNGNGVKNYDATITLANGCTLQEAYQYCQAICSETSAVMVNGIEGWRFRALANYTPNDAAPMGSFSGGKWLLARGWKIAGVLPSESLNYQLTASDGTPQTPPNRVSIQISNLVVGDAVVVGRDTGATFLQNEYTLAGAHTAAATAITVNEAVAADTPDAGTICVGNYAFDYSSRAGKVFTLKAATGTALAANTAAFVPFIYKKAQATSESASFLYNAPFTARLIVRNNDAVIQPFETTFPVGASGGSINVIRNSDQ
jgi:hypothetical protein